MTSQRRTTRNWLRLGIALPVLLGLGLVLSGGTAVAAHSSSGTDIAIVTIRGFAYEGDLTVLAGATVLVRNADSAPHTLTAVDGSFTTKVIKPGGWARFRAPRTPGNYAITCTVHPRMSGTLTVGVKPPRHPVVVIKSFAYQGDLTVRPGSKVTVRNEDTAPHTLTAVDGSFTTIVIPGGGTATFRAPRALGSYPITCTVHPRMMGTLTVARIATPQPAPPPAPAMAGHHH